MRIAWTLPPTAERIALFKANTAHARSLGLPYVVLQAGGRGVLNIVGRGPSIAHHLQIIRDSDDFAANKFWRQGDVWAVGTAWRWCAHEGINATFVCADPSPIFATDKYTFNVKRAILAEHCDPAVFHQLRHADVRLYDVQNDIGGVQGTGTTSAAMALLVGMLTGYTEFRFWGCEGSYAENTHADRDEPQTYGIRLRCNGQEFRTNPQMVMQSEELADVIRAHPDMVKDCSGGLLGAMVASGGEWELLEYRNAPENIQRMLGQSTEPLTFKETEIHHAKCGGDAPIFDDMATGGNPGGNPGWGDDGAADAGAMAAR